MSEKYILIPENRSKLKKAEEETMANFQKMLKEIARRNGTTPEHVRQEMQRALRQ